MANQDRKPPRPRKATGRPAPKRNSARREEPPRGKGQSKPKPKAGGTSGAPGTRSRSNAPRKGGKKPFKRTSKNTDDRNPTRSGTDYPSRKFRPSAEEAAEAPPRSRASLRKVRSDKPKSRERGSQKPRTKATRRRRARSNVGADELARLGGRDARRAQEQLARAAEAYTAGRERDAARLLRPLRDAYPDAASVRELLGLCHYRMGQYPAATKELEAFVDLSNSVEQHPVLMDCLRAQGKYAKVDELWEELALASPSGALVTEGRIVLAGSRADRGRLRDAIATLDRRATDVKRVQEHHLRLWYALADLFERAGEIPRARELFLRIRKEDASFADVAERLAALR
jgi:tetratricopeptide (TPR) repeat protein